MTIARIQDVIKTFGGNTVVDRVSFDIDAGETFVLLGPSGSGKSSASIQSGTHGQPRANA